MLVVVVVATVVANVLVVVRLVVVLVVLRAIALHHFRRHVNGSADHGVLVLRRIPSEVSLLAAPKVGQLHLPLVQQHVGRFDVPVDHPSRVQVLQPLQEL